jgi:hypothetical protein
MASSGNFCTINPLIGYSTGSVANLKNGTFSNGNLKYVANGHDGWACNMAMTGKTYCEVRIDAWSNYGGNVGFRSMNVQRHVNDTVTFQMNYSSGYLYHYKGSSEQSNPGNIGGTVSAGSIVMMAYDPATYRWWVGVNGTWRNSGDPANGTGYVFEGSSTMFEDMSAITWGGWKSSANGITVTYNFGQDSTFGGQETAGGNADENGFGDFKYSPPTGFLATCSGNLGISDDIDPAQTDDNFPQKQFNCVTYTGNASTRNITGVGFQPDLVITRGRSEASVGKVVDSTRGVTKVIQTHSTSSESTDSSGLTAFGSDGYTLGSDAGYNNNTTTYVAWCWRANGGTTASNSDGDITSTVQANTKAGFSIVTYTGDNTDHRGVGYGSANIGHGLDSAPEFIITKRRNGSGGWYTYHAGAGIGYVQIDSSAVFQSGAVPFGPNAPTTTTFGGYSANNNSGHTYVCYCWHSVEGYSKFGSYEGNGNTDGTFVYTGFRPRMVLLKQIDGAAEWACYDTARDTFNMAERCVEWDLSAAEKTSSDLSTDGLDFLSNGFKFRGGGGGRTNQSGRTFIYAAWGDVPFKYNNTF